MMITALLSVGEGPRNFLVNKDVPVSKDKAPAAVPSLPPIEETIPSKEEEGNSNNISASKIPGDMTLIKKLVTLI